MNGTIEGETYSHIISKAEIDTQLHSVTIISPSCVESGVYTTALMADPSLSIPHRTIIF
jgi:thiamine biosynthesis lipoprotein ApbE